jgi:hypothetical protein
MMCLHLTQHIYNIMYGQKTHNLPAHKARTAGTTGGNGTSVVILKYDHIEVHLNNYLYIYIHTYIKIHRDK